MLTFAIIDALTGSGYETMSSGWQGDHQIADRQHAQDRARSLMAEAVRLLPTHDIYVSEMRRMAERASFAPEHA
jgi:hypothetical protein